MRDFIDVIMEQHSQLLFEMKEAFYKTRKSLVFITYEGCS